MPVPSAQPIGWSNAEAYAKRKNKQEGRMLHLRIRKINREQTEAKHQRFEESRKLQQLTQDAQSSTGYGVTKTYIPYLYAKMIFRGTLIIIG